LVNRLTARSRSWGTGMDAHLVVLSCAECRFHQG
jgi:hypothetical protein